MGEGAEPLVDGFDQIVNGGPFVFDLFDPLRVDSCRKLLVVKEVEGSLDVAGSTLAKFTAVLLRQRCFELRLEPFFHVGMAGESSEVREAAVMGKPGRRF